MKLSIKKAVLAIAFCCVWGGISAQNIQVFFPYSVGKEYFFVLNEGARKDTVQRGVVGENGNATVNLRIPEKYKGYTGMGSWSTIDGSGINFVINNEDFTVTCMDSVPSPSCIVYKNSSENERMNRYEKELHAFYGKIDSIFKAENVTQNRDILAPSFLKSMRLVEQEYIPVRQTLASDASYAAFFWRTLNYIRGLGKRIYYTPEDTKDFFPDFTHYVTDEIDITRLYYSGLWNLLISTTFETSGNDRAVWGENMVKMLKRTKPQAIFDALATDVVIICEQFGWDKAEPVIIAYLESSGRLPEDPLSLVNRVIAQSKIKIGDKAPMLNGKIPTNAIIIFYESGCHHCQIQLGKLTKDYAKITEKGMKVISVSTDENQEVYEYHSKDFPWPDKYCDFKGFKGENVKNYGVAGTPTIYLIDEKGIIRDRQPKLEDIKALNLN